MEKIESIYEIIVKSNLEALMQNVIKDINIIDFAIISSSVEYKTKIYNVMIDKYIYDLDMVGFTNGISIIIENMNISKLSEESIMRNNLSMLRRWIIRCSGYMCIKRIAEETMDEGIDIYMKRYSLSEDIKDINSLRNRLEDIDEDILSCLKECI